MMRIEFGFQAFMVAVGLALYIIMCHYLKEPASVGIIFIFVGLFIMFLFGPFIRNILEKYL